MQIPKFQNTHILNKQIFILPVGDELYRVGSTYEWSGLESEPDPSSRIFLEEKLQQIISLPYRVADHKAGVRPTIKDRRPVLGRHPDYPQLAYFNGLGTKGVMLAPYFSQQMAEFLTVDAPRNDEVLVERFC